MNSSSFESPKPYYPYVHNLKNSIAALFKYVILAQNNLISILLMLLGVANFLSPVYHLESVSFIEKKFIHPIITLNLPGIK